MPREPRRPELSRDTKISIITLREAGFTYKQIQGHYLRKNPPIDISLRQIQHTVTQGHPTPQKKGHVGRPTLLTEEQVDKLEAFIISSKTDHLLSYFRLSIGPFSHFGVSQDIIKNALQKRGVCSVYRPLEATS